MGCGKIATGRARVRKSPAGLGQDILKWSGKVGIGKV